MISRSWQIDIVAVIDQQRSNINGVWQLAYVPHSPVWELACPMRSHCVTFQQAEPTFLPLLQPVKAGLKIHSRSRTFSSSSSYLDVQGLRPYHMFGVGPWQWCSPVAKVTVDVMFRHIRVLVKMLIFLINLNSSTKKLKRAHDRIGRCLRYLHGYAVPDHNPIIIFIIYLFILLVNSHYEYSKRKSKNK